MAGDSSPERPWRPVETGLPDLAPISWATVGGGLLFTAHVPLREDGTFETGEIKDQARLTFDNLRRALEAAGSSLDDVLQVTIYVTDVSHASAVSQCWQETFSRPFPNRAIIGVPALTVEGMAIELTAVAVHSGT